MDIILKHFENKIIIGIECKNKKKIVKNDIDKFFRDLSFNGFNNAVFIS